MQFVGQCQCQNVGVYKFVKGGNAFERTCVALLQEGLSAHLDEGILLLPGLDVDTDLLFERVNFALQGGLAVQELLFGLAVARFDSFEGLGFAAGRPEHAVEHALGDLGLGLYIIEP